MKPNPNLRKESQPNMDKVSFDSVALNMIKIKDEMTDFGLTLQKIVDEIQNVPDGRAVDAFKQQVLQKQMVLETLVEENSCTLELLKHDVVSLTADVQDIKSQLHDLDDVRASIPDLLPPLGIKGSSMGAVDALRRHPLSSIPPRQLSEREAIRFLEAIDEIVAADDEAGGFKASASGE